MEEREQYLYSLAAKVKALAQEANNYADYLDQPLAVPEIWQLLHRWKFWSVTKIRQDVEVVLAALQSAKNNLNNKCTLQDAKFLCTQYGAPLINPAVDDIPTDAIALIKRFEGFFAHAYVDPLSGGKPITIGYGSTVKPDGTEWHLGDTITQEEATHLLCVQLKNQYLPHLQKIPCWDKLNSNQRSALISFAYNLGASFYGSPGFSSITEVLRDQKWDLIEPTFLKYCNPGSKVEEGLKNRRAAEAKLFLSIPPKRPDLPN